MDFFELYGKSAKTALGFLGKSGWAFVLRYFVSGMTAGWAQVCERLEDGLGGYPDRLHHCRICGGADTRIVLDHTLPC